MWFLYLFRFLQSCPCDKFTFLSQCNSCELSLNCRMTIFTSLRINRHYSYCLGSIAPFPLPNTTSFLTAIAMSDKQPRRRGRPKKIRTEEEWLAAQRRHTRTYYDRLQQEDIGSVPYAKFYQYAPQTSVTSSTGPQLPACCTPPDSSDFLPSNDPENPDDRSDPFMVGGSTRGQVEVNAECC
jgi:hypothetical protein